MALLAPSVADAAVLGSRRAGVARRRGLPRDARAAALGPGGATRRGPGRFTTQTIAPRAFFGKGDDEKDPFKRHRLRDPTPFPASIGVGFQCALAGAKTAVTNPSQVWGPMTGATLVVAVALDVGGTTLTGRWLNPGEDAGALWTLVERVALVAVDGAWLLVSPLVAIAVVQQLLPLLGEKILFDALKAPTGESPTGESPTGESPTGESPTGPRTVASSSATPSTLAALRTARVAKLEASDGLGLRSLGVAAARAQSLATLTGVAVPIGVGVSLVPVAGPFIAGALAAAVAAYSLTWELLDPYFDKAGLDFEAQERVVWGNAVALTCFGVPFSLALAVPFFGPMTVAVAQGAAAEVVWRVLERDPEAEARRAEIAES